MVTSPYERKILDWDDEPQTNKPGTGIHKPWVLKSTILIDPSFLSLLYVRYILCMPGSKEDFQSCNAFSLSKYHGHALAQEPLLRGS